MRVWQPGEECQCHLAALGDPANAYDSRRLTRMTSLTPLLGCFLLMEARCCPPGLEWIKLDAFPPPIVMLPSTISSVVMRNSIFNRISFILLNENKLYCHGGFMRDQDVPKDRQRQQTIINSAHRAVSLHPLLSRLCRRKYLSHGFWA